MPASALFSRVSLSHLRQCLSPETSLEERSSAIKRPAAEGEGGEEEEPKKKLSFGINKPQEKGSLVMSVSAKKPLSGISIKLGQTQVCMSRYCN